MKYLLTVILVLISHNALAGGYLTPLRQGVLVEEYLMHNNGGMTIWVSNISNPDNCTINSRIHIKGNMTGSQNMISAVMTASATGKKVGFTTSGCQTTDFWGGTNTVPIIDYLWIVK